MFVVVEARLSWTTVTASSPADRVQQGGPRCASPFQDSDKGAGPAGDEPLSAAASPVDVAEEPVRVSGCAGTRPVAHVRREDGPSVGRPRQPGGGENPAGRHGSSQAVDRLACRPVTRPVLAPQRQLGRRRHRTVATQHRVGEPHGTATPYADARSSPRHMGRGLRGRYGPDRHSALSHLRLLLPPGRRHRLGPGDLVLPRAHRPPERLRVPRPCAGDHTRQLFVTLLSSGLQDLNITLHAKPVQWDA